MTKEELTVKIQEYFSDKITEINKDSYDLIIVIDSSSFMNVMGILKNNKDFDFDYLMCLSGADYPPERLEVVYHLFSLEKNHRICVKTGLSRENPVVSSVVSLWRGAEWHEREAYDLFGITFEGNPDLRRMFLPEDFQGHPLRKDYSSPDVIPSPDVKELIRTGKS